MKDHHHHHRRQESSSFTDKGANKNKVSPDKRKKKRKPRREWFWEDPQKRFQFIQSTLIICNVIAIFLGVTGLILAGFLDHRPIYRLDTLSGQLTLVSVFTILTSLAGLYGARRESVTLLIIYGSMILIALVVRSLSAFVTSLVSDNVSIAASMITAFLEIVLIFFAFALAADVRIKKIEKTVEKERQKDSPSPFTESSGNNDSSSSASSSSSSSPPSTSCDREALRV
jgi:magnesium-transporting ATPase (P-type)